MVNRELIINREMDEIPDKEMDKILNNEMDEILDKKIKEIFCDININELSDLEKRNRIYSYLVDNNEYDFQLLNSIYIKAGRNYLQEVLNPLHEGKYKGLARSKGVCNGISYAYKLLLQKVGINSMLIGSKIRCSDVKFLEKQRVYTKDIEYKGGNYYISHMLVLVQNSDGTFSYDDPTCEILHRNEGISYFNFDSVGLVYRAQEEPIGIPSEVFTIFIVDYDYKRDERRFQKSDDGFYVLPKNICKYNQTEVTKEQNR